MKVRVLIEQPAQGERGYLPSGGVAEVDVSWAKEMLSRGDAEPVAEKRMETTEKRAAPPISRGQKRVSKTITEKRA